MDTLVHQSDEKQASATVHGGAQRPAGHGRGKLRALASFVRNSKAVTAMEAAFVMPVFLGFLFGFLETTMLYFTGSVMEGQVAEAARQIRTGVVQADANPQTAFRNIMCDITVKTFACDEVIIDVRTFPSFGTITYPSVFDADDDPTNAVFQNAGASQVVLVRTYYRWKVVTPLMGYLIGDGSDPAQRTLQATAIFRTEPFS